MGSVWDVARIESESYPALYQNTDVDVAIVGAGITGLTTALRLAEEGLKVAVLDAMRVAQGDSGGSTGNLYGTYSSGLATVRRKWEDEVTRKVAEARMEGVALIEATAQRLGIDCQFERRPLFRCLSQNDEKLEHQLEEEYQASRAAGLKASLVHDVPLPYKMQRALRIDEQAQFNPVRYLQGVARAVQEHGGVIYEDSPMLDIDAENGVVHTQRAEVRAKHIVQATHTPKGINVLQAEMEPYIEYGISAKLKGSDYPEGIFWIVDGFYSVRSYHYEGEDYLLVIGSKHKTGHSGKDASVYDNLRQYARSHFQVESFEHAWSAQQFKPADGLPYIGRMPLTDNVYIGTGYAADGLVWGAVAGMIISDQIMGRDNRWSELFDPKRFTPAKSAKNWLKENVSVAEHYVKGFLTPAEVKSVEEVGRGEGKIVSLGGEKLAVYRDQQGKLSVLTAICSHMKCLVHWNGADATWDCPCHGSRFGVDGSVKQGPALEPLEQRAPRQ